MGSGFLNPVSEQLSRTSFPVCYPRKLHSIIIATMARKSLHARYRARTFDRTTCPVLVNRLIRKQTEQNASSGRRVACQTSSRNQFQHKPARTRSSWRRERDISGASAADRKISRSVTALMPEPAFNLWHLSQRKPRLLNCVDASRRMTTHSVMVPTTSCNPR